MLELLLHYQIYHKKKSIFYIITIFKKVLGYKYNERFTKKSNNH